MILSFRFFAALIAACCVLAAGQSMLAAEPTVAELVAVAKSGAEAARLKAINQLGAQGEKAAEAVPALAQLLTDASPNVRAHAANALGRMGNAAKPATEALANLIKDNDEGVRRQAVNAIASIRPGPQVMVPLFVRLVEESDPAVQARMLHAVTEAGPAAMPSLLEALKNDKAAYWACLILREMGPAGKEAVPALIGKLKDPRPEIRREAALALGAMQNEAASAAPVLAALLDDETAVVAATFVLGQIGQLPQGAEAKVRANAKSDDKMLSTISLWTLARVNPKDQNLGREAAEKLVSRLSDPDPFVRVSAAQGIAALNVSPDIMRPIVEKALAGADEQTARHALDAVATLGEKAVPRLIEAMKHEKLQPQIAYTLGQIGPAAAPATDALVGLLMSKNSRAMREAAVALGKIGPAAAKSVPALTASLAQEQCPNPHAILFALGKMGPAAGAAKAEVTKQLAGQDQSIAVVAAWALAQIDPQSSAAKTVPVLIAGLGAPVAESRSMAANTLGSLKSAAKSAVPALEKASRDEDQYVREAAAEALQVIRGS